jgi:hypothetical protein
MMGNYFSDSEGTCTLFFSPDRSLEFWVRSFFGSVCLKKTNFTPEREPMTVNYFSDSEGIFFFKISSRDFFFRFSGFLPNEDKSYTEGTQ